MNQLLKKTGKSIKQQAYSQCKNLAFLIFSLMIVLLTSCGSSGITGKWVLENQGSSVVEYNSGGEFISYKYDGSKQDLVEDKRGTWELKDDSLIVTGKYTCKVKIESGVMESIFKNDNGEIKNIKYLRYKGLDQLKDMRKGDKYGAADAARYIDPCFDVISSEEISTNTFKVVFERTTNQSKLSPFLGCECCNKPTTNSAMVYYDTETCKYRVEF